MAAMRSAFLMLARRRCASSRSSAAASMVGGRGLEVHQVLRPAAPPLRPLARNLELQGLHRFSTGGMKCTDQKKLLLMKRKAENVLGLWWQRVSDHVKTYQFTSSGEPYMKNYRSIYVLGTITGLALLCYLVMISRAILLYEGGGRPVMSSELPELLPEFPYFMLAGYRHMHRNPFGGNRAYQRHRLHKDEEMRNRSSSLKQARLHA